MNKRKKLVGRGHDHRMTANSGQIIHRRLGTKDVFNHFDRENRIKGVVVKWQRTEGGGTPLDTICDADRLSNFHWYS